MIFHHTIKGKKFWNESIDKRNHFFDRTLKIDAKAQLVNGLKLLNNFPKTSKAGALMSHDKHVVAILRIAVPQKKKWQFQIVDSLGHPGHNGGSLIHCNTLNQVADVLEEIESQKGKTLKQFCLLTLGAAMNCAGIDNDTNIQNQVWQALGPPEWKENCLLVKFHACDCSTKFPFDNELWKIWNAKKILLFQLNVLNFHTRDEIDDNTDWQDLELLWLGTFKNGHKNTGKHKMVHSVWCGDSLLSQLNHDVLLRLSCVKCSDYIFL